MDRSSRLSGWLRLTLCHLISLPPSPSLSLSLACPPFPWPSSSPNIAKWSRSTPSCFWAHSSHSCTYKETLLAGVAFIVALDLITRVLYLRNRPPARSPSTWPCPEGQASKVTLLIAPIAQMASLVPDWTCCDLLANNKSDFYVSESEKASKNGTTKDNGFDFSLSIVK